MGISNFTHAKHKENVLRLSLCLTTHSSVPLLCKYKYHLLTCSSKKSGSSLIPFFSLSRCIHLASLVDSAFEIHSKSSHFSPPLSSADLGYCNLFLLILAFILARTRFHRSYSTLQMLFILSLSRSF